MEDATLASRVSLARFVKLEAVSPPVNAPSGKYRRSSSPFPRNRCTVIGTFSLSLSLSLAAFSFLFFLSYSA